MTDPFARIVTEQLRAEAESYAPAASAVAEMSLSSAVARRHRRHKRLLFASIALVLTSGGFGGLAVHSSHRNRVETAGGAAQVVAPSAPSADRGTGAPGAGCASACSRGGAHSAVPTTSPSTGVHQPGTKPATASANSEGRPSGTAGPNVFSPAEPTTAVSAPPPSLVAGGSGSAPATTAPATTLPAPTASVTTPVTAPPTTDAVPELVVVTDAASGHVIDLVAGQVLQIDLAGCLAGTPPALRSSDPSVLQASSPPDTTAGLFRFRFLALGAGRSAVATPTAAATCRPFSLGVVVAG